MNKIYLITAAALAITLGSKAQNPCASGRYATETFTAYTTNTGVTYGANLKANGTNQVLTMDIYQPTGDAETSRPLIILAHGGSFSFGASTDYDVTKLCQTFAKKGFVTASINYRLGISPFDSIGAIKAVIRAAQDMKASVRFFYKDKLTTNTYKIDTNNIFIGGSSAGAVTALHQAYLKKTCQYESIISEPVVSALGGLQGNSGNPCYSEKIKGVINLCGGIGKHYWIESGDAPVVSLHGTNDGTVNYNRASALGLMFLDGSRVIKEHTNLIGLNNPFYTWYGAPHVPYNGTTATKIAYMDTTIKFVTDFLISNLGCPNAPTLLPNVPFGTATLFTYTVCSTNIQQSFCTTTNINENKNGLMQLAYPNPSNESIKITFFSVSASHLVELTDVTGQLIFSERTTFHEYNISKNNLAEGIYFLKVTTDTGQTSSQKIVFN